MSKTSDEKLQERIKRIAELTTILEKTKAELMELTGLSVKASKSSDPLPSDFQLQEKMLLILKEKGRQSVNSTVQEIQKQYGFRADKKVVQSSLYSMKDKGLVERVGKGRGNVFYQVPST